MSELAKMDATAQAELVREGRISPLELVEDAIRRIEKLNPKINAVITPLFDAAREAARGELPKGPFTGVPFLLKDILASCQGVPLTSGSRFLADFIPDHDSELVRRLRKAGLIFVGKTNTPELGLHATTEPEYFGPTRNPWDPSRTPGGSSGGAAAAVASGMVPMAHGNDGGGSIRIPSSCCGVFGLKPTRGRISLGPDYGDILSGLVVEHALTRSVRDSAALLDATAGPGLGDPYYASAPPRSFSEEVKTPPGRLRIAFTVKSPTGGSVHRDCVAAVLDAVNLLRDLGHEVEERDLAIDGELYLRNFLVVWCAGAAGAVAYSAQKTGRPLDRKGFEAQTWALYELGVELSALNYLEAVQNLQLISRQVAQQFVNYSVWLTPALGTPPPPLGTFAGTPEDPLKGFYLAVDFAPFSPLINATGQCAMSLPLFWNAQGLPIGIQFIGGYGGEGILFRLASQLEQARPWSGRRPPFNVFEE